VPSSPDDGELSDGDNGRAKPAEDEEDRLRRKLLEKKRAARKSDKPLPTDDDEMLSVQPGAQDTKRLEAQQRQEDKSKEEKEKQKDRDSKEKDKKKRTPERRAANDRHIRYDTSSSSRSGTSRHVEVKERSDRESHRSKHHKHTHRHKDKTPEKRR
jgi:hypothetical protein